MTRNAASSSFTTEPDWFESEAQMLWPLAASVPSLLGVRGAESWRFEVFFEVPAAAGVPDMLLVEFNADAITNRELLGVGPVVASSSARVLSALVGRWCEPARLAEEIGFSESHLRRTLLAALLDLGAVDHVDGRWSALGGVRSVVDSVVAVEAKRRDWKGALKQARRYARFANVSFMAVDARGAAAAISYGADIAALGVGLVTVAADGGGNVRVHRRPRWRSPQVGWEAFVMGERLWDLARQDRRSGPPSHVFGRVPAPTPDRGPIVHV